VDGDIINVDVTVYLDGYHGDTSSMFYVGTPSPMARRLCEATKEALQEAIKVPRPGLYCAGGGDPCTATKAVC
jgi:methionyl aminopeptidase